MFCTKKSKKVKYDNQVMSIELAETIISKIPDDTQFILKIIVDDIISCNVIGYEVDAKCNDSCIKNNSIYSENKKTTHYQYPNFERIFSVLRELSSVNFYNSIIENAKITKFQDDSSGKILNKLIDVLRGEDLSKINTKYFLLPKTCDCEMIYTYTGTLFDISGSTLYFQVLKNGNIFYYQNVSNNLEEIKKCEKIIKPIHLLSYSEIVDRLR